MITSTHTCHTGKGPGGIRPGGIRPRGDLAPGGSDPGEIISRGGSGCLRKTLFGRMINKEAFRGLSSGPVEDFLEREESSTGLPRGTGSTARAFRTGDINIYIYIYICDHSFFRGFGQEIFFVSPSVCDSRNWNSRSNSFVRAPSSGSGSNAPRPAVSVPHLDVNADVRRARQARS